VLYWPGTALTIKEPAICASGANVMKSASKFVRQDPQALALSALGWILGDPSRADRLLALTGITPDDLRAGLDNPAILGAVLDFLLGHESDLIAAADALAVSPESFAHAREQLS
jgi:hypothetical protein